MLGSGVEEPRIRLTAEAFAPLVRRWGPFTEMLGSERRHDHAVGAATSAGITDPIASPSVAPIAPPGERGRGPARPECCTVQGPQENGAGGANTSVTRVVELGVVAAQPSRLWGGRPLLRVTTRSGFSELFTLNGRGYCRNSSSFRSKPPSVEPKDSGPIRVERLILTLNRSSRPHDPPREETGPMASPHVRDRTVGPVPPPITPA